MRGNCGLSVGFFFCLFFLNIVSALYYLSIFLYVCILFLFLFFYFYIFLFLFFVYLPLLL